jgi:hypothetical protein
MEYGIQNAEYGVRKCAVPYSVFHFPPPKSKTAPGREWWPDAASSWGMAPVQWANLIVDSVSFMDASTTSLDTPFA